MITKHFFKILTTFMVMIILGLVGLFAAGYYNQNGGQEAGVNKKPQVAK